MNNFFPSPVAAWAFVSIVAFILGTGFAIFTFRPYRNTFMRWYMRKFDKTYHSAKQAYENVLSEQKIYEENAIDMADAYHRFFEHLLSKDNVIALSNIRIDGKEFSYEILRHLSDPEITPEPSIEIFEMTFGGEEAAHKVEIVFMIEDSIDLCFIKLFYCESPFPFYHRLEQKKFPPSSGSKEGKDLNPKPVPATL